MTHDGKKGWFFNMICPGNSFSISKEMLFMQKNATVQRNLDFNDVCKEKYVSVAYNNEIKWFEVSNITGKMVEYPVHPYISYENVAWEWEIQAAFFTTYNIHPQWINCNYTWGSMNHTTGQWSGAVGLIQRDEVDYAVFGFTGTYARSKVAAFPPATDFNQLVWLTRYPKRLSPTWNLVGLFSKVYN